jgi:tRNA A37 methylthiotransferase MiaB
VQNSSNSNFKTFYIYGRTCPRRNLDASRLGKYFSLNNLEAADNPKKADLIIIFTCGVFAEDEEHSIFTIEKSMKNKKSKIVITGCLPKINPHRIENYLGALVINPEDLFKMDNLIQAEIPYESVPNVATIDGINSFCYGSPIGRLTRMVQSKTNLLKNGSWRNNPKLISKTTAGDLFFAPTTYKLEIAKGCLGSCSYCAIKLAMVKFHSFPEEQIVESFKSGLKSGYTDIALVAGDIGCYGLDLGINLPHLLTKLFAVEGDFKILLWDLNVRWFANYYPEFQSVLKANSGKISRLIMPIESGSDHILKLMNRSYEIQKVKEYLSDLQKTIPDLRIDTQIIVGFPGETEENFQESVDLVKEIKFSELVIFKYQDRPNTKASNLPGKLEKKTIDKRAEMLAKVASSSSVLIDN